MTKNIIQPPKRPWVPGVHPDYSALTVEIAVCQDQHQRVFSEMKLRTVQDYETARQMPSGGTEQVAFALLTEAVRREAVLCILMSLPEGVGHLGPIAAHTEEEREAWIQDMRTKLTQQIASTTEKLAESVLVGVLNDMLGVHQPK